MIFLQLVLSLDKTIEGINSILPIVSYRNRELKEKMFLLGVDNLLLQTDVSPSNKLMDRSRTEGETVFTLP